jgi:uncharacterized protein (TIGR02145 family)
MFGRDTAYSYSGGTTPDNTPYAGNWPASADPCPTGWHVPTEIEYQAMLAAASSKTWTTSGSIYGMKYTFSSGLTLFFPAAGSRSYHGADNQGTGGGYWSATYSSSNLYGRDLYFDSGNPGTMSNSYTYNASSVRCVRPV